MNKPNITNFVRKVQSTLSKHSPEILTGLGIAGMVTTTILAVKATPKAMQLIEEKKEELQTEELTVVDTVKSTWKCYIPAAVTGVASTACIIGASSVNMRRNAALATAYKISETALSEYREAVVETIGEKKAEKVKERVAEKQLEKNPISNNQVVFTNNGETLCYDAWSGRYFKSDIEVIKKAENKLNRSMMMDMSGYLSLNEFYREIGLESTEAGDVLGWNIRDDLLKVHLYPKLVDEKTPCAVIDFDIPPKYDFDKF